MGAVGQMVNTRTRNRCWKPVP